MGPLVETKLSIPRHRRGVVARLRLHERLRPAGQARLTLISAPAGFGKTTLLTDWLASAAVSKDAVAWLSLDENDSQTASFWTYVFAALQTVVPGVGADALPLLQSGQAPVEAVLATVINDLSSVPDDIYLVLDDYHLADGPGVQAGMVFLLGHLPSQVHLVVSTRADPALPLARLRARGELVEVRAADLRFSLDEVAAYLNQVGLNLAATDIVALESRTEGWIAALQLVALSMQGRNDVASFIDGFTGDDRYIVDYLVEEVLRRQPEPIRTFLLHTSILDRMSGPLCDAVTARQGGKAVLESLERANLFVVALDDSRQWYRYHHLFADVLRTHVRDERPDEVADLHRRASQWHHQNGEDASAIRHALAAGEVERAADLIELNFAALRRSRQEAMVRGWLDAIGDDVIRNRPVLAVAAIGALLTGGEFEGVEARLQDAELRLASPEVVLNEEVRRLPGEIQMYRAALALARGDAPATIEHASRALEHAAADDHLTRAGASGLIGLVYWGSGDLDAAQTAYSTAITGLRQAGHISDVLGCSITLADIRSTQGRLGEALRAYEEALLLAPREGEPVIRGTADMYVGMSQIAYERNDLDSAARHLRRSDELGEHVGLPQNPYRWRVAMARVRAASGDLANALRLLDDAQRVYVADFSPNVCPIPAVRARLLAAHGRVGEALGWAREHVSMDDELSYLREYEHITLARVLLSQQLGDRSLGSGDHLAGFLERLLTAAEQGARGGSVIEILVLQALTRQTRGDTPGALESLHRALGMAEPEGYVRTFVAEGPPMATLLRAITKQRGAGTYVRRLVEACEPAPVSPATRPAQRLVDPLSDREMDVLRLLGSDLDGPSIARELAVSLNTLRTHTKNIYTKLGVNSRRAAVRQARELNLMPRTHHMW